MIQYKCCFQNFSITIARMKSSGAAIKSSTQTVDKCLRYSKLLQKNYP